MDEVPPSERIARIFQRLTLVFSSAAERLGAINASLAKSLRMRTHVLAGIEIAAILTAGFTMVGVAEYAAAVFFWLILALLLAAKIVDSDWKRARNIVAVIGSILVSVILITWTNIKRSTDDWSAFSAPMRGLVNSDKNVNAPAPPLAPVMPQLALDLVGKWKMTLPRAPVKPTPNLKTESSPTPRLTSSDPYVGQPDSEVAKWTLQEAESLNNFANQCETALEAAREGKSSFSPEMMQLNAWREFIEHHKDVITELHESLSYRLGPIVMKDEEPDYEDLLLSENANSQPSHFTFAVCMDATTYSSKLAALGRALLENH